MNNGRNVVLLSTILIIIVCLFLTVGYLTLYSELLGKFDLMPSIMYEK